ncbi:MAG: DHH family phosphoesterase [Nanoarchaeota archaeon]|nr:DHH family phosphoesterase [Nanoarchaeota archaeon]
MKFIFGKEEDFFSFLESVGKKDKAAIVSHTDLDGVTSALLMHEILKSRGIDIQSINFVNYGMGVFDELSCKLKKENISKVFLSDINEDSDLEGFERFRNQFDIFLIDHHPSESGYKNHLLKSPSHDCSSFVIYNLGVKVTSLDKWKKLVCAAMIADFSYTDDENFRFIKNNFPDASKEDIYNSDPGQLDKTISYALIYFRGEQRRIFDILLEHKTDTLEKYRGIVEKDTLATLGKFRQNAEFYPDANLYFYYYNPRYSVTSIVLNILSKEKPDNTFIFASDVMDDARFSKASSRNQSGNIDMNLLMRKGIHGLENASGGGHVKASAAKFMKKDFEKFKENILKALTYAK